MKTHKAYRLHSYGGPDSIKLDDVAIPKPGVGQVLVAVGAVGINPYDWKIREGYLRDMLKLELPTVLGADFVGTVTERGEGSQRFNVGERVMGVSTALGAYAEHIAIDEALLARVPKSLSDVDAAILPVPVLTAWTGLHAAGELRPGMKVLVHGASGVCGAFAVQLAKAAGASVIATGSGKNRDYVLSIGAEEYFDYKTERFEDHVDHVDLVLDYAGSEMVARSWKVVKADGAVVSSAAYDVTATAPAGVRAFFALLQPNAEVLEKFGEQAAAGKIRYQIAQTLSRGELLRGIESNKSGGNNGRIIVDFKQAGKAATA
jgi:NADPH:quinone reductase-like Zn-dependent oxidoreductase